MKSRHKSKPFPASRALLILVICSRHSSIKRDEISILCKLKVFVALLHSYRRSWGSQLIARRHFHMDHLHNFYGGVANTRRAECVVTEKLGGNYISHRLYYFVEVLITWIIMLSLSRKCFIFPDNFSDGKTYMCGWGRCYCLC